MEDAKSEDSEVRRKVAINPNTPIETLEHLSNDRNIDVKMSLANNPHITDDLLQKLTKDIHPGVSGEARMNLIRRKLDTSN